MGLTEIQNEIVKSTSGHYVVLAGPGCGKTHTIIEKILYMIENDKIPEPYGILAMTFTDAAARIMRARLRQKGFSQWDRVWIGTYHSFGHYILRCYSSNIGLSEDFEIIAPERQKELLERLIKTYSIEFYLSEISNLFAGLKRQGIYPGEGDDNLNPQIQKAYKEYNQILREENLLDFGDLVAFAVKLLNTSDYVYRIYNRYFRYVIVDEFQDTDKQQYELIQLFAQKAIGSTIVGDDDQSIFGWRGALRDNVYKIQDLLSSEEIVMGQNFRSDKVIVEAAKKVIGYDPNRKEKDIEPVSKEKGYLYKSLFETPEDEAEQIVKWIIDLKENKKISNLGRIAIISRTIYRSEPAIKELKKMGIPWFNRSSLKFQESWETTLGMAIIQLAHDPHSSLFLSRVMGAIEDGGLAYRLGDDDALNITIRIRNRLIDEIENDFDLDQVDEILKVAQLFKIINEVASSKSEAEHRILNLNEMIDDVISESKLHSIDLLNVIDRLLGFDAIQIITGHQAKGCEFDIIFFIGLEDDMLPHYRSRNDPNKLAEERRIFYVGLTRARNTAYLTNARKKMISGDRVINTYQSRFVKQIPNEFFTKTPEV